MKKEILNINKEKSIQLIFENNIFIIETLHGNMLYKFSEKSAAFKKFEELEKQSIIDLLLYSLKNGFGYNAEKDLTSSDLSIITDLIDAKINDFKNSNLPDVYCDEKIKKLKKLRDKISFLY